MNKNFIWWVAAGIAAMVIYRWWTTQRSVGAPPPPPPEEPDPWRCRPEETYIECATRISREVLGLDEPEFDYMSGAQPKVTRRRVRSTASKPPTGTDPVVSKDALLFDQGCSCGRH